MGINLDKIRQRLAKLQGKGNGQILKLQEGETVVRIVPTEDEDPFKEANMHYKIGGKHFKCPQKSYGEPCPVCDYAWEMYRQAKKDEDKENLKIAKDMLPSQRFYSPVIVRGEEKLGVRWLPYSKTVYEKLLGILLNPEYGDITDVTEGTDLTFVRKQVPGKQYPDTDVVPKRNSSPLADSKEKIDEYLNGVPDLSQMFDECTKDEIEEQLRLHLEELNGDAFEKESQKYGSEKEEASKEEKMDSIDKAFDELTSDEDSEESGE